VSVYHIVEIDEDAVGRWIQPLWQLAFDNGRLWSDAAQRAQIMLDFMEDVEGEDLAEQCELLIKVAGYHWAKDSHSSLVSRMFDVKK
jgi:hypothetical protein